MPESFDDKQIRQENEYVFPYHYIPEIKEGFFTQTRNLYWGYEYLSYLQFLTDKLNKIEFNSLLDVGCGEGKFLYEVKNILKGKKICGIDYSERPIAYARAFNPNLDFRVMDITRESDLLLKSDVITLIEVLEHIPIENIENFLTGIDLHLNDHGYLVITVPSKNVETNPKHYQHFDSQSISLALDQLFEIEEIFYLNSISWQTTLIQRLLSNRFFILNSKKLKKLLYNFYKSKLLLSDSNSCKRICVIARKK